MGPAGLSQFGSIPTSFTLVIAPTRRTSCSEWLYLKKVEGFVECGPHAAIKIETSSGTDAIILRVTMRSTIKL
jgi:hypothetical protein